MRAPWIIAIAVLGSACSTPGPAYQDVLGSWAGAPEAELRQRWGPPTRSQEAAGRKVLAYESRRTLYLPGTAPVQSGMRMTGGSPAMNIEMSCTTTFELANAQVMSWSHTGNDCGAKPSSPPRT